MHSISKISIKVSEGSTYQKANKDTMTVMYWSSRRSSVRLTLLPETLILTLSKYLIGGMLP